MNTFLQKNSFQKTQTAVYLKKAIYIWVSVQSPANQYLPAPLISSTDKTFFSQILYKINVAQNLLLCLSCERIVSMQFSVPVHRLHGLGRNQLLSTLV